MVGMENSTLIEYEGITKGSKKQFFKIGEKKHRSH